MKANQNRSGFSFMDESFGIADRPQEGVLALRIGDVVAMTTQMDGQCTCQCVVGALHEKGRTYAFLALFVQGVQNFFPVSQHTILCGYDDSIGLIYSGCFRKQADYVG